MNLCYVLTTAFAMRLGTGAPDDLSKLCNSCVSSNVPGGSMNNQYCANATPYEYGGFTGYFNYLYVVGDPVKIGGGNKAVCFKYDKPYIKSSCHVPLVQVTADCPGQAPKAAAPSTSASTVDSFAGRLIANLTGMIDAIKDHNSTVTKV